MIKNLQFIAISILAQHAFAQTPESLLEKIDLNYTSEKIYIHYDKTGYVAGETIFFKVYLMEGFLPALKSTVVSVEILNEAGRTIERKILPVIGSMAAGNFDLDKTLQQGSYTIRAYTKRLMNFGTESYYAHTADVYNPQTVSAANNETNNLLVYFLPEGGNLIGNINNTIAFKSTDNWGYPVNTAGRITDASGKELATFKSIHNGMGKFEFAPKPGEKYFAECAGLNAEKKTFSLPDVQYEGTSLKIKQKGGKTFFEIDKTAVTNAILLPEYIMGVVENKVAFRTSVAGAGKIVTGAIPMQALPSGILQLTVFNKENKPLAERLVFNNSGDFAVNGNLISDKPGLYPREKKLFSFELTDTLPGTFSVAVTDADSEIGSKRSSENIVTRFLLTSDIKGFVFNPAYYFESNDNEHKENLDLVMLTHGWRRYSWNEIMTDRFPAMNFKDPDYVSIEGTAYDPVMGKPLSNAELSLFINTRDKSSDFFLLPTDNEGNFKLPGLIFEDTAQFSFMNNTGKKRKINFRINSYGLSGNFNGYKSPVPIARFFLPDETAAVKINKAYSFKNTYKGRGLLLDEVKVNAKTKSLTEKYEKRYISGRIGGEATKTLDFIKDPPIGGANLLEYLKSRLSGVNISGGPSNYSINYRSTMSLSGGMIPMNIFVDEVQVQAEDAATLRVNDVALVKVYSTGISAGAGGALAIYTKRGEGGTTSGYTDMNTVRIEGFSPVKEFFSPDYTPGKETDILKDERSTIYWNPYLIPEQGNKRITFSFFNSDQAKKLKIILEGMLSDGKILHLKND